MWLRIKYHQRGWPEGATFHSTVWSTQLIAHPLDLSQEKTPFHASIQGGVFGNIDRKANIFANSLPTRAAVWADSSVAHKLTWPNGIWMHAFGLHIATKMECGNMLCTSGWEMTKKKKKKNQDLKGDIYIYISMLLFIKTLFSNKKNCFV